MTYQTTVAELGLSRLGVYPVALTVQSAEDGEELGRLQTQLPYFPPGIDTTGTRVALLWPLLDRPHRLTGGGADRGAAGERPPALFGDDGLADAVRDGGRLDRLLDVAEQVAGSVRLTLLVDPETIEELDRMAAGYRVGASAARSVPGRGAQAAAGWLGRLPPGRAEAPAGGRAVRRSGRGGAGPRRQLEAGPGRPAGHRRHRAGARASSPPPTWPGHRTAC